MELFPSVSKNSKSFFFLWELEVILPLYDLALFTSLKSQAEKYCSLIYWATYHVQTNQPVQT